jgi:hypothetical protein
MTTKVCKRHQLEPAFIYGQCIGCEIEYYQKKLNEKDEELEMLNKEMKEIREKYETVERK